MNTTTNLSELMQTYYDRKFLKRVSELIVMDQFAQQRPLPKGEGKVVSFQRYLNLATAETALTEGANPAGSNLSAENVTCSVAEYGDWVKISSLVSLTAIDVGISEKIPILGTQCGETMEALIRNEVCGNGTEQIVSTAAAVSDITATDVISSTDIKKAVRDLKNEKAIPFSGGYFAAALNPDVEYDFMADSTWVSAKQYSGVTDLYKGEIGRWFGVRCVTTTVPYRSDTDGTKNISSGAVRWIPVMGMEGYGVTQLNGAEKKMIVKNSGPQDTSNPLDRFSTAGWTVTFVPKMLKAEWVRVIKCGATA